MRTCLSVAAVMIIIAMPLYCGAQKNAPAGSTHNTSIDSKDKQGKDQIPPLRELCILNYKTDFSTLADKYKEDLFFLHCKFSVFRAHVNADIALCYTGAGFLADMRRQIALVVDHVQGYAFLNVAGIGCIKGAGRAGFDAQGA